MLSIETVISYIQDEPRFNILLDNKEQFGEDVIETFISITYKEVGALVPSLIRTSHLVPDIIILHGTLANLFRSEQFKELRNQLQYSDSNLNSLSVFHKNQDYAALSSSLKNEFKIMLKDYASARFAIECWGCSVSNSMEQEVPFAFAGNEFFGLIS